MSEEAIVVLAYFGMGVAMILICIFVQPVSVMLIRFGVARAQSAEARLLEAQNEAARLRAAIRHREQEEGSDG